MLYKIKNLSLCAALFLGLSACGLSSVQRDAVIQFSTASAAFGETISTQMVETRSMVIDLNTHVLLLDPSMLTKREKIEGAFSLDRVGPRIQAAKAVQTYGELLLALVEDTQEKELQTAATNFTQSIRGLDSQKRKIGDDQLQGIGEVVVAIGGLWVEYKKREALEQIVPEAHEQIKEIGKLFATEFAANGAIARNLDATSQLAVRAADGILDQKGSSPGDRSAAAMAHRKGIETSLKANAIFPPMATAALEMVKAHSQLVNSLLKKELTVADIKVFTTTVEDLLAASKLLAGK